MLGKACSVLSLRVRVCVLGVSRVQDAYYGQNTRALSIEPTHPCTLKHAHVVLMRLLCVYRKIRETLNNLILKAPQEWHTQVALPFVKIEGTTVEWDEMRCKLPPQTAPNTSLG